ncbi:serine hydrolase [Undibacterium cyanobacteriorum]|uniref:Serine hydrolase n=1 Tax=Undibacterium cyanobacteriorum TaxID=3073561 RepID=A0ABY9RR95_9BURK|nr:serine hydrolase [Undibacterium sp. 20NA77.5]WMW82466.1 serine hydrolase [Undibacterium sp. 20NA77.5]
MKLKSVVVLKSVLFATLLASAQIALIPTVIATPLTPAEQAPVTYSTPLTAEQIDSLVERTLKTFNVPGISVAVIKDDKVVHAKGYGVRSIRSKLPMQTDTMVGIASNSKAFTAAALAILVDEGKLQWGDKVNNIIPEFKLYNPYVTEEFTVLDLMTHRSGMGLGAGDLMFFPDGSDFTIKDVIHNLRYLKQTSSFRSQFDYDNNLYIVAGEVIKRVSGLSWEDFIEQRIMRPLGMQHSAASISRLNKKDNQVEPHVPVNGALQIVPFKPNEVINAAGGIYSNIDEMSHWVRMQLNRGRYGHELQQRLFSEKVQHEMWSPHTIIPMGPVGGSYNTHFTTYGIGWDVRDVKGYKQVSHTGGLLGMVTQVTMIPELKLGIVVLTNQEQGAAFTAITNTIKDSYLGMPVVDRIKENADRVQKRDEEANKITAEVWKSIDAQMKANGKVKLDVTPYVGVYKDDWFGEVSISVNKVGQLQWASKRSPALIGDLSFYRGSSFVVKWHDRSFNADAFVNFQLDTDGNAQKITMKAISPLTDFSFDFHDLELRRVEQK